MVITAEDLEMVCPICKGSGQEKERPCSACAGKGTVLTTQGQTLLHVLKKYIKD